jgi:hypothetical protein
MTFQVVTQRPHTHVTSWKLILRPVHRFVIIRSPGRTMTFPRWHRHPCLCFFQEVKWGNASRHDKQGCLSYREMTFQIGASELQKFAQYLQLRVRDDSLNLRCSSGVSPTRPRQHSHRTSLRTRCRSTNCGTSSGVTSPYQSPLGKMRTFPA